MNRPTLKELIADRQADYSALSGLTQLPIDSYEYGLAAMQAAAEHSLYAFAEYQANQSHPRTCNDYWLSQWADAYQTPRLQPQYAAGEVALTGTDGLTIPSGTTMTHGSSSYITTTSATIDNGTATVSLRAVDPGIGGNLVESSNIGIDTPVAGIDSDAIVSRAVTGGADLESVPRWRERVVSAFADQSTHIGDIAHYTRLAKKASSLVSHVWITDNEFGPGSVTLRLICDSLDGRSPDKTTLESVDAAVQAGRIAGRSVEVRSPVAWPLHCTIALDGGVDTTANRAAISASIRGLVYETNDQSVIIRPSNISEAINTVTTAYNLVYPTDNQTIEPWQVVTMGFITWQ